MGRATTGDCRPCVRAAFCFLAASLIALDPVTVSIAFGVVPFDATSYPTIAAALASMAALFGVLAVTPTILDGRAVNAP